MDRLPIPVRIAPGPFTPTGTCGHYALPPIATPRCATHDYDLPACAEAQSPPRLRRPKSDT